uniref:Uncharacterized protein n=1 Tax=Knipowitschia caucasica TaxID=637954 RepID=A0AAV2LTD6_KNICA
MLLLPLTPSIRPHGAMTRVCAARRAAEELEERGGLYHQLRGEASGKHSHTVLFYTSKSHSSILRTGFLLRGTELSGVMQVKAVILRGW